MQRSTTQILVIHSVRLVTRQLQQALQALGYTKNTVCASHMAGLEKVEVRKVNLILLEARKTDMPVIEFVNKILAMDSDTLLVAITGEPRIDDVFGFLKAGGRGFLVPPFTTDVLEETLERADSGPPISDAVLNANDRNSAFSGVMLNNLYRVAVLMRQVRQFPKLNRDLTRVFDQFVESCQLGRMFCEGSDEEFRDKLVEACIARANVAATRLGRTRKKLEKKRTTGEPE